MNGGDEGRREATGAHLLHAPSMRAEALRYALAGALVLAAAGAATLLPRAAPEPEVASEVDDAVLVDLPPALASAEPQAGRGRRPRAGGLAGRRRRREPPAAGRAAHARPPPRAAGAGHAAGRRPAPGARSRRRAGGEGRGVPAAAGCGRRRRAGAGGAGPGRLGAAGEGAGRGRLGRPAPRLRPRDVAVAALDGVPAGNRQAPAAPRGRPRGHGDGRLRRHARRHPAVGEGWRAARATPRSTPPPGRSSSAPAPFPPAPAGAGATELSFTVPIRFRR